jgi:DNA-binding response OmpR family regulator
MDKIKVLLAEDELALAHIVRESMEERDFSVSVCADGEHAFATYQKHKPDILVLDVMMPKLDGFELARRIRETDKKTPIIFLTARSQVKDVIIGFETGANDYIRKPFSVEELIIRIRVLLSNDRVLNQFSAKSAREFLEIGNLKFDPDRHQLQSGTDIIRLTTRESEVLRLLFNNRFKVVARNTLLEQLWGDDSFFNARSLDVFITKLRKLLKADNNVQIINVRGVGYKLIW